MKRKRKREKEENKRMAMVGGGEWKTEIKRGEGRYGGGRERGSSYASSRNSVIMALALEDTGTSLNCNVLL